MKFVRKFGIIGTDGSTIEDLLKTIKRRPHIIIRHFWTVILFIKSLSLSQQMAAPTELRVSKSFEALVDFHQVDNQKYSR
jgi:hypothetical protein